MELPALLRYIQQLTLRDGNPPVAYMMSFEVSDFLYNQRFFDPQSPSKDTPGLFSAPKLLGRILMDETDLPDENIYLISQLGMDRILNSLKSNELPSSWLELEGTNSPYVTKYSMPKPDGYVKPDMSQI